MSDRLDLTGDAAKRVTDILMRHAVTVTKEDGVVQLRVKGGTMGWPEIDCIHGEWQRRNLRDDDPYDDGQRHCSYCGSLHPEDLFLLGQASLLSGIEVADWKYGWPHKLYVDIPNLRAGTIRKMGSHSWTDGEGHHHDEATMEAAPEFCMSKFYTEHLKSCTSEQLLALQPYMGGVEWFFGEDGKLRYRGVRR